MLKNKKGFTLVELLAVIVILAIILAIAIPGITGMVDKAKLSAFESDAKLIISGIDYRLLEAQMGNGVAPVPHAAALTGSDLSELSNYGANPNNYESFQIVTITPEIQIKVTTSSNSKFGSHTATVTKTQVTY